MCKVLSENGQDSFNTYVAGQPASLEMRKNLLPLEGFFQEMNRVLSSKHQNPSIFERRELQEDWKPEGGKPSPVSTSNLRAPSITESNMLRNVIPSGEIKHCSIANGDTDIKMVDKQDDTDVSTTNVAMDITE